VFPVRYGLYLCVPYGSHSKQRLFPQTALTGWRERGACVVVMRYYMGGGSRRQYFRFECSQAVPLSAVFHKNYETLKITSLDTRAS
jgi:hypothetical protein